MEEVQPRRRAKKGGVLLFASPRRLMMKRSTAGTISGFLASALSIYHLSDHYLILSLQCVATRTAASTSVRTKTTTMHFVGKSAVWRSAIGQAKWSFGVETRKVVAHKSEEVVVKVMAAGINMSDVKMVAGLMPFVKPPIVSGRDYSGVVVSSGDLMGKEVYGTAGSLGFLGDGTHAQYVSISSDLITEKPSTLTHEQAGTLGVPYFTAYESLVSRAAIKVGEVAVVQGATGMVGTAALGLAKALGATTVALVRRELTTPLNHADHTINTSGKYAEELSADIVGAVGCQANVFLDTVGGDATTTGISLLGPGGRLVVIASPHPTEMASFNIFDFYRKQIQVIGINTIGPDKKAANALKNLRPFFESGFLHPLPISSESITLEEIPVAFESLAHGARERILVLPWK